MAVADAEWGDRNDVRHAAGRTQHQHGAASSGLAPDGDRFRVPDNITLPHLPPESPELNPVETVRATLRSNTLSNRVFNTYAIVEACCDATTS